MDKELEEKLVKTYPKLYKNYYKSITESCMGWGFTCGNGWFDIINELSQKLEPLGVVAEQVKEKFGGLTYIGAYECDDDNQYKEINNAIREAESKSYKTCENCGQPGKVRGLGYIKTLCEKCNTKKE